MNSVKPSAAQFAYETIKDWVLSGFLRPGEKVDQDALAEKLGLSRMPIRSALDRLSSEGLVVKTPHRGVTVSALSDVALNDLFDVRAQIESMAIMLTTAHASDESIQKLYNMLTYHQDSSGKSLSAILNENRAFHRYIVQLSENETLLRTFDSLWEQSERYRRIYFQIPDSNTRVIQEHYQIADLIAKREVQQAADFLVEHTRNSQRKLLEMMHKEISPKQFRVVYLPPSDVSGGSGL